MDAKSVIVYSLIQKHFFRSILPLGFWGFGEIGRAHV